MKLKLLYKGYHRKRCKKCNHPFNPKNDKQKLCESCSKNIIRPKEIQITRDHEMMFKSGYKYAEHTKGKVIACFEGNTIKFCEVR